MKIKTVHLILNAHLDPIWLWPWTSGLDAAVATCRNACDRLETHRDIFFSRGEAWVYDQIEQVDPRLFARIRKHVKSGQWNIVGGWWIQPDCNLPLGFAMRTQIELGKRYFTDKFGQFPTTAYNVDSFGHAASLPGLMREAGQSNYVMMRPQEHEHALPARLFRWRGYEGGHEVTTFRIAGAYTTGRGVTEEHVRRSLTELPPHIEHTMCFIGLGDHGGGASEKDIAWCRDHADSFDGWRLEFSTPDRFFAAIKPQIDSLPLVTGELQMHAVGCYSVYRPAKVALRRGEHLLAQAQIAAQSDPTPPPLTQQRLDSAWRQVCFHHFHDTIGGTCIPSAYPQVLDQLGYAAAIGDEILQHSFRRRIGTLPPDPLQRILLGNFSDTPFDGYIRVEPWTEWEPLSPTARLLDEDGIAIPFQQVHTEAIVSEQMMFALLFKSQVPPGQMRAIRFDKTGASSPIASQSDAVDPSRIGGESLAFFAGSLLMPRIESIDDPTDTWSHGIEHYGEEAAEVAAFDSPLVMAAGPLMASVVRKGRIGRSSLQAEWLVYAGEPFIELRLRVLWTERHKVLKLVLPLPSPAISRIDGIMDGELHRDLDSAERPLRDWSLVQCADGSRVGVVAPDVFALDASPQRMRFTLLRGSLMAHHDPKAADDVRGIFADDGPHEFRFWFYHDPALATQLLEHRAAMAHRPLLIADVTLGMPSQAS
jgi:alpha-mannosidase